MTLWLLLILVTAGIALWARRPIDAGGRTGSEPDGGWPGSPAAPAIGQGWLTADLGSTREEVRASRRRILERGDEQRRLLARDLHDGIQGRLVAAAMAAGQLATSLDGPSAEAADRLRCHLDTVITDLRHLVHGMAPPVLVERGLFAAVSDLAGRIPLPIEVDVEGLDDELSWPVASAGYFIVAEACANAVKHADARSMVVSLAVDGNGLWLDIADDGRGGAAALGSGGLQGMRDRVAALSGVVRLQSPVGAGTRLEVRLPCEW